MAAQRGTGVRIEGLRRLRGDLRKFGGDISDLKAAALAAGAVVATAASARAPRLSGKLASSLRPGKTTAGVVVRSTAPYGGPIHYGWPSRHIVGRPFVIDAAQATEPKWLELYLAEINRAISKIDGRTY